MKIKILSLAVAAFALGACTGPVIMGTDAAITMATRPSTPPPADTEDQIPAHESWCYSTMGEPQCYVHAQDVAPERLINVDPQSRYPVNLQAYRAALSQNPSIAQASTAPVALSPDAVVAVEKEQLKDEVKGTQAP